jgi:hypothetical protein
MYTDIFAINKPSYELIKDNDCCQTVSTGIIDIMQLDTEDYFCFASINAAERGSAAASPFLFFPTHPIKHRNHPKKTGLSIFYSAIFDLASRVLVVGEAFGGDSNSQPLPFLVGKYFIKAGKFRIPLFLFPDKIRTHDATAARRLHQIRMDT